MRYGNLRLKISAHEKFISQEENSVRSRVCKAGRCEAEDNPLGFRADRSRKQRPVPSQYRKDRRALWHWWASIPLFQIELICALDFTRLAVRFAQIIIVSVSQAASDVLTLYQIVPTNLGTWVGSEVLCGYHLFLLIK